MNALSNHWKASKSSTLHHNPKCTKPLNLNAKPHPMNLKPHTRPQTVDPKPQPQKPTLVTLRGSVLGQFGTHRPHEALHRRLGWHRGAASRNDPPRAADLWGFGFSNLGIHRPQSSLKFTEVCLNPLWNHARWRSRPRSHGIPKTRACVSTTLRLTT